MPTFDPWSSSSCRSSSGSFDSPRNSTPSRREVLNLGAVSSVRSDGAPATRTIAIGLKAHKELRREPFFYAFDYLVEQKNCKVVVICCMSRLQSEMGVDHKIDVETFGGISMRKLEAAVQNQIKVLDHYLKAFRERLAQRGVQLEVKIAAGPKSEDILVQAAKALHPHWVVLDAAFSGDQRKIHERLECNLVLVRKNSAKPILLQLTPKFLAPIEQLDQEDSYLDCPTPFHLENSLGTPARMSTPISTTGSGTSSPTSSNSKISHLCMCFSTHTKVGEEEGPTKETTVLYGNSVPGSQGAYLGKVVNECLTEEVVRFSSRISSPSSSPAPFFSGSSWRRKSIRNIEQDLENKMAKTQEENAGENDFQEYKVQL